MVERTELNCTSPISKSDPRKHKREQGKKKERATCLDCLLFRLLGYVCLTVKDAQLNLVFLGMAGNLTQFPTR